ncbi:MAG: PGF-pre-PGF domain-containing protein [Candidatus Lokiarchaeota archaeon]|nr:PGF-pre-PGF domain-containing protein [Candidatus Woesearchaeota archaeon]MBD3405694.1 PGF-pre-PGF domain-containing protein [Candidatus Lokiarchaeota archaeon]
MNKITPNKNIILIIILIISSTFVFSQEIPIPPAFYSGNAYVKGVDAPVNSLIIARINTEKKGETKINTPGKYGHGYADKDFGVVGEPGDTVEFYIKIPGYKEIKAEEEDTWQSGTINSLDLNFNGNKIPVADNSGDESGDTNSGGSSGGGGGGGSGSSGSSSIKETFYYPEIESGKQISFSFKNKDIPFTRIQLILKADIENADFIFEIPDKSDVEEIADAYKYVSVDAEKATDHIDTAVIRFRVQNDWIESKQVQPENIVLMRYSGGAWKKLETEYEGSDAQDAYFSSYTPGFSYFAIVTGTENKKDSEDIVVEKQESIETKETETSTKKTHSVDIDMEKDEEKNSNDITGQAINTEFISPDNGFFIGIIVMLTLVIAGLFSYIYISKNK